MKIDGTEVEKAMGMESRPLICVTLFKWPNAQAAQPAGRPKKREHAYAVLCSTLA